MYMHIIHDTLLLDNVWKKFAVCRVPPTARCLPYAKIHRQSRLAQQFEDWLFTKGGTITQIGHRRFLSFYNEHDAAMFLLTEI